MEYRDLRKNYFLRQSNPPSCVDYFEPVQPVQNNQQMMADLIVAVLAQKQVIKKTWILPPRRLRMKNHYFRINFSS